jgi:hypothetical protein
LNPYSNAFSTNPFPTNPYPIVPIFINSPNYKLYRKLYIFLKIINIHFSWHSCKFGVYCILESIKRLARRLKMSTETMKKTKNEKYRMSLVEKIPTCTFHQVEHNLTIASHRTNSRLTFEEFKTRITNGEYAIDLSREYDKHSIAFYCSLLLGKINLDKETFIKEYESGKELDEIGEKYNVTRDNITQLRDFYGIKRKGATFIKRVNEEMPLTEEAKQVIVGSLLGDGTISKGGDFREKHSLKQEEYLKWKAEKIGHIVNDVSRYDNFDERYDKMISGYLIRTKTHSFLIDLEKLFYKKIDDVKRIKIIPENISEYLNPLVLAIWFMDDGTTGWNYRHGVKQSENAYPYCALCTDGFSNSDIENLIIAIKHVFGLNAEYHMHCNHNENQDVKVRIRFDVQETKKLFEIIKPHIHQNLLYKINGEEYVKYYNKKMNIA